MEKILLHRLELMITEVNSLSKTTQTYAELNDTNLEAAQIVSAKLQSLLNRLNPELHNYFTIAKEPDAAQISELTVMQLAAEENLAELKTKIEAKGTSSKTVNPSHSRLPKLDLPTFSGDVLEWSQFWDQFKSNIGDRNINDVDKLLYLKASLTGEARATIDGLDSTNKNYQIATSSLKERYGRENQIIDAHYSALFNTAPAKVVTECRKTLNEVERHLRVLQSLGENCDQNHLRFIIKEKFPPDIIYEMSMRSNPDSIQDIRTQLNLIISAREDAIRVTQVKEKETHYTVEALYAQSNLHTDTGELPQERNGRQYSKRRYEDKDSNESNPPSKRSRGNCIFCKGIHYNDECTKYKTSSERRAQLTNRCFKCLAKGHFAKDCSSRRPCYHCKQQGDHHRALCNKRFHQNSTNTLPVSDTNITILQTAVVKVKGENGASSIRCRMLFDSGSQRSYITQSVAKKLRLPVEEEHQLSVFTFGSKFPQDINSPLVKLTMETQTGKELILFVNVVPTITHGVPYPQQEVTLFQMVNKYPLADDGSLGTRVDILLGNDYYYSCISTKKIKLNEMLFLVESEFGLILSGKLTYHTSDGNLTVMTYFQSSYDMGLHPPDLPLDHTNIQSLWDLESIGITDSPKASRDEEALKQFNENTRYENQRYSVCWPWNEYPPNLPSNYGLAFGRLVNLIKRLDPKDLLAYEQTLKEQMEKGIIEPVPDNGHANQPIHYLPHHGVKAPGKAIRIVYDASSKIRDHKSLNQCLYCGPMLLEDLTCLSLRFRFHPIGISADVEKAFLQLTLQYRDRDVTRFLWLKDPTREATEENIIHLRFTRVPFGVVSSPFLLNASIKHHLQRSQDESMERIANDIYVDNLVTGANTTQEAIDLYTKAKETFQQISMNLREWRSNSKEFMQHVNNTDSDQVVKLLGLNWNIESDTLSLRKSSISTTNTKRGILSSIASIYDPCGFLVPSLLPAKLMLQDLWTLKIKWDAKLSLEMTDRWNKIKDDLERAQKVCLPRCYLNPSITNDYQVHCFTDASSKSYAACVYVVSQKNISFVIGKSRLVPIKDQDDLKIPRLELLGVLIGSRLIHYVVNALRIKITSQTLWTDSQIVIDWYNSDKLLTPFVSRRIEEVKKNKNLTLRYVPSELNAADVATRTTCSEEEKRRWLNGPDFLRQDTTKWPCRRSNNTSLLVGESSSLEPHILDMKTELTDNNQQRKTQQEDAKSVQKVYTNSLQEIKDLQEVYYPNEVNGTETDLNRNLKLFKDVDGILRCKGRLKYAEWSFDKRYPILLPKDCEFTNKTIKDTHEKHYHVGANHTLSIIRQSYWIPQGKRQVLKVIRQCPRCIKHGGGPFKLPPTPPLPPERVNFSTPFTFTAIDYLGPVLISTGNGTSKRWICLFTCLAVRAIHLEVVQNLTAEEGLLALRRMISTRAVPTLITSDNALHFKMIGEIVSNTYCVNNKIRWRYIPQLAPWHGGFYERLVGLVKHCLQRTLHKHLLGETQLATVVKEIEAVINTRPLTSVDSELEQVLTPSDFLNFGSSITMDTNTTDIPTQGTATKQDLITGWKRARVILDEFKEMFCNRYLPSLRERYNHSHKEPRITSNLDPKIGQIVQIKGHKNREGWKVGKIVDLVKSTDGLCRVARVQVGNTVFTRSLTHLYPLELEVTEQEDSHVAPQDNMQSKPSDIYPDLSDEAEQVHQNDDVGNIDQIQVGELDIPVSLKHLVETPSKEQASKNEAEQIYPMEVTDDTADVITEIEDEIEPSVVNAPEITCPERPQRRRAAVKALEKIKQWSHNLFSILLLVPRAGSVVTNHEI